MTRKLLSVVLASMLIIGCTASICAADEPHMRDAIKHLREARADLEKAPLDKGRGKAIKVVNRAIADVEKILLWEKRHGR